MENNFIESMAKIDLHCHLDGCVELYTIRDLLSDCALGDNKKQELLNLSDSDFMSLLQVSENCESLTQYLKCFDLPLLCLQNERGLYTAAYNLIKAAALENIKYIEVRFAPMLSVNDNLSCKDVIESVISGLKAAGKENGVDSNVIVCAMRHHDLETNINMVKTAREFYREGVCGVDLAGDESAFLTKLYRDVFEVAKKLDMNFTIHSGECGSVENVREAIEFGAKRIGHGIALRKDNALIKECRDKNIGIEMCPTSNLQTKAIDSVSDYPFNLFWENGLKVTVNTDNRVVSNTTMTKELKLIQNKFCADEAIIRQLYRNAIEVSFASDDVKHRLCNIE